MAFNRAIVFCAILGFSCSSSQQEISSGKAKNEQMENDIYLFLKKVEEGSGSSLFITKNVTRTCTGDDAQRECCDYKVVFTEDDIAGYDDYSVSYSGTINQLTVNYSSQMGMNIFQGSLIKVGDTYTISEVSCGTVGCSTTIIKDGQVVYEN